MEKRRVDIILLVSVLFLVGIGTVMIYSSSSIIAQDKYQDGYYFIKKQILFVLLGLLLMWTTAYIPYSFWRRLAYPGLLASVVLLFLLFVPGLGIRAGGALRWLRVGAFTFQVSEAVKIALIVFLAHYMAKKQQHAKEIKRFMLVPLIVTAIIIFLIFRQPDFGTAVIVVAVSLIMLYLAGSRIIYLTGILMLSLPAAAYLVLGETYRLKRWLAFCDPWKDPLGSGFQIIQSFLSFGSGGAFGVGLGDGMQKLFYLPEPHTDFILSIIAEEGGFLCVAIVIGLFSIAVFRGFLTSFRTSDLFGSLLAAGLTSLIALEACINMAAVMGLIPTKGLVLPFVSYGGSSLIMRMAVAGMLLNISSYVSVERGIDMRDPVRVEA